MSRDDHDGLRAGVLRVVDHNTGGPQPDAVPEHVIVENRTRTGTAPGAVRDALATLVEKGALKREVRNGEAHYWQPGDS